MIQIKEKFRIIPAWRVDYIRESGEICSLEKGLSKRGILVMKIAPGHIPELTEYIKKITEKKNWRKLQFDVEISEHQEGRSLSQNGLYWALIEILAFVLYKERGWKDEVHEGILEQYAPREIDKITHRERPKRSKRLSKGEFAELIQGVFHELAAEGIPILQAQDIKRYWEEFYKWRWKDGRDLLVFKTLEDYRESVNYCEACMKGLRYNKDRHAYEGEIGNLAHIVSKGAGAGDTPAEVLHLCNACHIQDQHAKGWRQFVEKYPHLEYKITHARAAAGMKPLEEDLVEEEPATEPELDIF